MEYNIEKLININTKIAVLCGGMSSEREVSLRSGKNCYNALLNLGYKNTIIIDVDKNIAENLKKEEIEVAFLALHGKYGEDGCIQGLLDILGIKYTGCGVMASAIAMNKDYTKKILSNYNDIPLIKSIVLTKEEINKTDLNLNYPLMIKPISEGSSIGMAKVETPATLKEALENAFQYSSTVLVEEFLQGLSTTVGVLEINGKTVATPILAFRTKTEWYDFDAKYTAGLTEFELPAKISDELTQKIQEIAVKSHKAINAAGVSRVDFLIDNDTKTPYVLEINTLPGMTDLSDLPAQAKAMGLSFESLVNIILNSATITDK